MEQKDLDNIVQKMLHYLDTATPEQLAEDRLEIEKYNKIGPTVSEYLRSNEKFIVTEDFVSFDIAKLLKKSGFDAKCRWVWILDKANDSQDTNGIYKLSAECFTVGRSFVDNDDIMSVCKYNGWNEHSKEVFLCPTIQMAKKWLKVVHNVGIFPSTYTFTNADMSSEYHQYGTAIIDLKTYELITEEYFPRDTEEETIEAAIKYFLENERNITR